MAYSPQFGKTDTLASQMAAGATSGTLSSGNFTNFTSDYLVLDYKNPSKREVILCNVTGTAIASATRAQAGTSDVTHSAGADVAYAFVPAHYTRSAVRTLGYAEITSDFSTTNTTVTDVTGLTVTVTVPSGGARIKITVFSYFYQTSNATAGTRLDCRIYEGATQLQGSSYTSGGASFNRPIHLVYSGTASAGSHTYKIATTVDGAGTTTVGASATAPAFILVENIE